MTMQLGDFDRYARAIALPEEGRQYVESVRASPPARRVQSNVVANCCYHYVSHRMGFTIMGESHIEHRFGLRCELHRDEVLEYWDQPTPVPITGTDRRGRCYRSSYTADFLILTPTQVVAIETKPYARCQELRSRRPSDWQESEDRFVFEPARRAFALLGIAHRVVTDKDIGPLEASNFELLLYARDSDPIISARWKSQLSKVLLKNKVLSIGETLKRTQSDDVTPILFLIGAGALHADLKNQSLADVHDTLIAIDAETLSEARRAQQQFTCAIDSSIQISTQEVPSAQDGLRLLFRIRQLNGESPIVVSKRTLRRWRSNVRSGGGELALMPRISARGNRKNRISADHASLIDGVISSSYLTADSLPPYRCYGDYVASLERQRASDNPRRIREAPITFKSFLIRLRRLDPVSTAMARGGRRAANEAEPAVAPGQREILACRPFQRAHIDHAKVKVHLRIGESDGRVIRARAWLTIMVDEFSGAILAMSLSLRAPSRRSCALVLRDGAMRWGRLPETIVVDNGKEFGSIYFEACLARLGIHKQSRPPAHPRYGSSVERAFGVLKDELLCALPGNAANKKEDRGKSTSHKGYMRAKYSLLELHQQIEHYFFRVLNNHISGSELEAPTVRIREGLRRYPSSGRVVTFDQAFLITTSIEQCREHTWNPRRGIRFRGRYYNHPGLAVLQNRRRFEVREEPWDGHCIYVLINGDWLACFHGPSPTPSTITTARICTSILWSDANCLRGEARVARLIAVQEQQALRKTIEKAADSGRPQRQARAKPEADFPAFQTSATPLPKANWSER